MEGQGSETLGDFGADLNLEMGEQHRDEVESREQASPQRTPAADLGKGFMIDEMEVPIRLFPAAYPVDEAYHPLLNTIARAHPETFTPFNSRSARLGALLLRDLHEVLTPWGAVAFWRLHFCHGDCPTGRHARHGGLGVRPWLVECEELRTQGRGREGSSAA